MKRKYILTAATLTVLCVGTAAYNMKQNTELPSDAPDSSSAPSFIASSEPESGSTSVTDNRDIAKAENFGADQVTKEEDTTASTGTETHPEDQVFSEETATGTETHPEDQVYVSDEQLTEGQQKSKDIYIQACLDAGLTPAEAEARWQEKRADGSSKNEEAQQKRDEYNQRIQAKQQARHDAIDQWYRENTGMSRADWLGMTNQEHTTWMYAHPDVDFSTSPEY